MKAKGAVLHEVGGPWVVEDIEVSEPGDNEVLVQVMASGVNPIEWKIRGGGMARALGRDLPVTCGWAS